MRLGRSQQVHRKMFDCAMTLDRAVRRIEMGLDRRKSERHLHGGLAKIQFGIGSFIFATGLARQCRLAWKIGCEFGAEFIDGFEARQFGRRRADANGLA